MLATQMIEITGDEKSQSTHMARKIQRLCETPAPRILVKMEDSRNYTLQRSGSSWPPETRVYRQALDSRLVDQAIKASYQCWVRCNFHIS
jgi:hypothetical protein